MLGDEKMDKKYKENLEREETFVFEEQEEPPVLMHPSD